MSADVTISPRLMTWCASCSSGREASVSSAGKHTQLRQGKLRERLAQSKLRGKGRHIPEMGKLREG